MTKFRTGNVIRNPDGRIEIVTNVTDDLIHTIPFDYESSSITAKINDSVRNQTCYCFESNDGNYDEECSACKGTGSYEVKIVGYKNSKFLASNVKSYIISRLTKNFGF